MTPRFIMIQDDAGKNIPVGLVHDGILEMVRKESVHLFKEMDAWGIDGWIADNVEDVHTYEIHDTETLKKYRVDRETFLRESSYLHFPPHRRQRFLRRSLWKVTG